MSASLLEMVIAITLMGLILVSAIVPTIRTLSAYEEAQLELRGAETQALAFTRVEQLVGTIWRDANPPSGYTAFSAADAAGLRIGTWDVRASGAALEQRGSGGAWAPLTSPVQSCSFRYLVDSGDWVDALPTDKLNTVRAVRCDCTGSRSGWRTVGVMLPPDSLFARGRISLPYPATSRPYARTDYAKTLTLTVRAWP